MTTTKRVPNRFSGTPDFPYLKKTNLKQGAHHIQKPTTWPVPHACAQPYHPGSGSHGQLFRPYWGLFEARDFGFESKIEASLEIESMLGMWDAKNNPRHYGISRNVGSGLRDWRTLFGTLYKERACGKSGSEKKMFFAERLTDSKSVKCESTQFQATWHAMQRSSRLKAKYAIATTMY